MKLVQLHTRPGPINGQYVKKLNEELGHSLANIFFKYEKLTGHYSEDFDYFSGFFNLFEEDEMFDPFSHLTTKKIEVKKDCLLSFGVGNSKLAELNAVTFALPAGYTCPFADECLTFANKHGKKFKSSGMNILQKGDIRCYSASAEIRYPTLRKRNWRNFDLLRKFKTAEEMADLIVRSIQYFEDNNSNIKLLRVHESGDFFSQEYFDAWMIVARHNERVLFYAYTKSLSYWEKRKDVIPQNFRLIASTGGKQDELITKNDFRQAIIVKDSGEAIEQGLHIDTNDFLAAFGEEDFALLLHGSQKRGTDLSKQAHANHAILRAAKKMQSDPKTVAELLQFYTTGNG